MPGGVSPADRRLLIAGTAVFVAILATSLLLGSTSADESEVPTTHSVASGGAKAIYLLLPTLGYNVERWVRPLQDLAAPQTTTLVLAEPGAAPTPEEREAVATFLARGGRIVVTGQTGAFFFGTEVIDEFSGNGPSTRARGLSPSAETRAAPTIAMLPRFAWPDSVPAVPMYGLDDNVLVVKVPTAAGDAYWWSSATPLTNAGISEPGNLEFVLATLGTPGDRRVLFDEYFHGARPTLAGSVLATPAKWLLVQLVFIAIAIVLTWSRRSGPIVVPAVDSRLSSLEYVQTMGSLYQRAGASVVPVEAASRRLRAKITRQLGLASDATTADLEHALTARLNLDDNTVAQALRASDRALTAARLAPRKALAIVQAIDTLYRIVQSPQSRDQETH